MRKDAREKLLSIGYTPGEIDFLLSPVAEQADRKAAHEAVTGKPVWHYGAEEQPEAGRWVEVWYLWLSDFAPVGIVKAITVGRRQVWCYSDEPHTSPPPDEVRKRLEELGR